MGRRKKEPRSIHRGNIASAASALFMKKGITETSMDDIAKEAGYSKATLYVYFENKEEIISILVLESMRKLYHYISTALETQQTTRARYDMICQKLLLYQEEFPLYFKMVLDKIDINFQTRQYLPEEKETYQVGEDINEKLKEFIMEGMEKGELRNDIEALPVIFTFWGTLSGLIQLAYNKKEYISSTIGFSKKQFLEYGFNMLYRSIENVG